MTKLRVLLMSSNCDEGTSATSLKYLVAKSNPAEPSK